VSVPIYTKIDKDIVRLDVARGILSNGMCCSYCHGNFEVSYADSAIKCDDMLPFLILTKKLVTETYL